MALRGTGRPRGHWVVLHEELAAQRWQRPGAEAPPRGGDLEFRYLGARLGGRGLGLFLGKENRPSTQKGVAVSLHLRQGISGDRCCAVGLGEVPEVRAARGLYIPLASALPHHWVCLNRPGPKERKEREHN